MAGSLVLLSASPTAIASGNNSASSEFIVGFEGGVGRGEQAELVDRQGAEVEGSLRGRALVIIASSAEAARLGREEGVRYVERNATVKTLAPMPPTDPQLSDLWGIKRIDAPAGWEKMATSNEVVVAVSDTGIWAEHEDLRSRLWLNDDEVAGDNIDNDENGVVDDIHGADLANGTTSGATNDVHGHGTHVAGTIGADAFNQAGVVGVAPYARLMNSRFLNDSGYGSVDDGVRSIDYAARNGARVINCSWGTTGYSQALRDAIGRARARGVLIVAAAGNSRHDADQVPLYPAAYEDSNVISVAATTGSSELASFSNYGKASVDLGAPGLFIRSTIVNGGSGYNSGTSMAAPHVSGIAAVLWGERPELDYWNIRRAILAGGSTLAALDGKTVTGKLANLSGSLDYLGSLEPEQPPVEATPPPDAPAPEPEPPQPPDADRRPTLVKLPAIHGSPQAPSSLTCDGGSWSGSADLLVRWMREGAVVGYGSSYATKSGDVGKLITCRGIALNPFGSKTADSIPLRITGSSWVAPPPEKVTSVVKPAVLKVNNNSFRCERGMWTGASHYEYSWLLSGKEIARTQKLSFKKRWRGLRVSCRVTAWGKARISVAALSSPRKIPNARK